MKETSTRLIGSGYNGEQGSLPRYKTINPPIFHASTLLFDNYAELAAVGRGEYEGFTYGTDGGPTQLAFEQAINDLEGGYFTRAFPSGLMAITSVLQAFLKSGDHLLICNSVYGPVRRFARNVLERYGVKVDYFPANTGSEIEDLFTPETRLILLESPGSNTFEMQDVPAVVTAAKKHNVLTAIDNTWATPLFFQPLQHGVDISIHSITKYVSGHSDVLLGTATVTEACYQDFYRFCRAIEVFAPQEACYLALRGLKTLKVRLEQHQRSALELATWLQGQEAVAEVLYPALPSHPEHAIWRRDYDGASGIFSLVLKEEYAEDAVARFVDSLQLFGIGYSWGGFKSLVTAGRFAQSPSSRYHGRWMIRLNIGLEETDDLRADIEQALGKL